MSDRPDFSYTIAQQDQASRARLGVFTTPHGVIETPAFTSVGTKATVKGVLPHELHTAGMQAVLANTYHLYLQPGEAVVEAAGGVGAFMNWDGPTFTDSGGFQVFSLGSGFGGASKFESRGEQEHVQQAGNLVTIDEDGVTFRSHIDGSEHRFTPKRSIEIQKALGADIIFAFDECTSPTANHTYQKEAMERTHRWATRSLDAHGKQPTGSAGTRQAVYGIVQGGRFADLRAESARAIASMDFDGFGIGGSFSKEDLEKTLHVVMDELPTERPRHLLGIGEPLDIFIGVAQGIDTFDCVSPTRLARTGVLYTNDGTISVTKARFRDDMGPLQEGCDCATCAGYSRAYVHHLFRAHEMLGPMLASVHNIRFITRLLENIRDAIRNDSFAAFRTEFLARYYHN